MNESASHSFLSAAAEQDRSIVGPLLLSVYMQIDQTSKEICPFSFERGLCVCVGVCVCGQVCLSLCVWVCWVGWVDCVPVLVCSAIYPTLIISCHANKVNLKMQIGREENSVHKVSMEKARVKEGNRDRERRGGEGNRVDTWETVMGER